MNVIIIIIVAILLLINNVVRMQPTFGLEVKSENYQQCSYLQ